MTTPDTASTAAATAAATIQRAKSSPFGSVLADSMSVAHFRAGAWTTAELLPTGPLPIHPAAHALHYGSECFEGFKAYRHADGSVQIFRLDRHVARLQQSARALLLPEPDAAQVSSMVISLVDRVRDIVPEAPGSLYLRPLLGSGMPDAYRLRPNTVAKVLKP